MNKHKQKEKKIMIAPVLCRYWAKALGMRAVKTQPVFPSRFFPLGS